MLNSILDLLLKQILRTAFSVDGNHRIYRLYCDETEGVQGNCGCSKSIHRYYCYGDGSGALIANFGKLLTALQNATGIQGAGLNTYPTMTAGYEKIDAISEREQGLHGGFTRCL